MNAKYDATAREGQVKRSRIIQTELEETREENQKLETRNNELEAINKELEKSVC
jgi:cell division protein FtsB